MKYLIALAFYVGFFIGHQVPRMLAKNETKYKVGDCLSNGLYYERVTGIRYGSLSYDAIYDLIPTIQGRLSAPDSTDAWIVHDSYVQVSERNCK